MKGLFYKFSSLLLITLVFTTLEGCLGTSEGIPYYTVSDEFAEYCWFQENSRWTYLNEDTQVKGNVIIGEVIESQRFNPENQDYNYQAVEMIIMDNAFAGMSKIELTAGDYQRAEGEMNSLMRFYYSDSTYQLIFMPQHPLGEDIILGDQLGIYTNMEILDTMNVLGTVYNDVWHTRIVVSQDNNKNMHFYIARGFGLVESRISTNGGPESVIRLESSSLIPKILGK